MRWTFAPREAYTEGRQVKCPDGRIGVVGSPIEPISDKMYVRGLGWYRPGELRVLR